MPHETDWETRYRAGDTPWEKGGPSPGLVEFLQAERISGSVLVPGCGFGHDVRASAQAGAELAMGLDVAPSAVEGARERAVSPAEQYRVGDFFELPEELIGQFNWVWEHTCFCAIDPAMRTTYAESAALALPPGGSFVAVFYMTPDVDDGGPPFPSTKKELDALFDPWFQLVREWVPERTYPGREGRELMRWYRRV